MANKPTTKTGLRHAANAAMAASVATLMLVAHPAARQKAKAPEKPPPPRHSIIAAGQVWKPTNIPAVDIKLGPQGKGAFAWHATVRCEYLETQIKGSSPKFECAMGPTLDDHFTVKYGAANGEVYGEVLSTRLLWALGFGADRMYPVTVICTGCPPALGGTERPGGERAFDPAVIERSAQGWEWKDEGERGWSWSELKNVDPALGPAALAQRDALTLLAVFLQHTDSKQEQQRILCLGTPPRSSKVRCNQPFLLVDDVGLTFGRANVRNVNAVGSVNLAGWKETPIWKEAKGKQPVAGCVGNISRSFSGTLSDPIISEEGRAFLSKLLGQLSDKQIRDLFETARVTLRPRAPDVAASGPATVDEWVQTFKAKRQEIATRQCP